VHSFAPTGLYFTLLTGLKTLDVPVRIAMEATGHYWLPLYEALIAEDYSVSVFNPFQWAFSYPLARPEKR